ncbi:MAG: hypothetical protein RML72_02915, partial [Bacteroidia bacterium]|nr:hypothetical protein [Bacteroidia bacterium]
NITTPVLTNSTSFYLEATSIQGCKSSPRTPVFITVNPKPAPPIIPNLELCATTGGVTATFTATAADALTNQILLYSDPGTTNLLQADNSVPYEFTLGGIFTSTTYYAVAQNTSTGCNSNPKQVTLNILPAPNPPSANAVTRCGAGSVVITVTPNNIQGGNLMRLYTVPFGGTPISTDLSAPYTLSANVGVGITTLYIEAVHAATGCTHLPNNANNRVQVIVTAFAPPAPPTVTPDSVALCVGQSATFTVSIVSPGNRIRFFNQLNASVPEEIIDSWSHIFTMSSLNATRVRFVDAIDTTTGCTSQTRTRLKAQVLPKPATPGGIGNFVRCSPGNVDFSLPSIAGATEFRLYTTPNALLPIATYPAGISTATISNLNVSTTYFLASANPYCESNNRLPIAITIHNGADLSSSDILPIQPICGSGQRPIILNPNAPALLQNSNPKSLRLYTTSSGGNSIVAQNAAPWQLLSPNITTTTTYYVELFDFTLGCATSRVPVVMNVNPLPAAPSSATSAARCGPGILTVSALPGSGGDNIRWYPAASGGSPLFTGLSFSQENANQNQTVYAASYNSITGCESAQRLSVALTIHPVPSVNVQNLNVTRCGASTVTLTVALIGGNEVRWYNGAITTPSLNDVPISITQNSSTHQFTLPNISITTQVTAAAVNTTTGCISPGRTFTITILPPVVPPSSSSISVCQNERVVTTVNYPFQSNYILRLYNAQAGGTLVSTSSSNPYQFSLNVSSSTTFWLSAFDTQNLCESERSPLTIQYIPTASISNISAVNSNLCGQGIPAWQGSLEPGLELRLYTQAVGGLPISITQGNAVNLVAPLVTTHTTLYLSVANSSGICESPRRSFVFRVNPVLPNINNGQEVILERCSAGSLNYTFSLPSPQVTNIRIYDASQQGNLIRTLGPPYTFNTGPVTQNTTFYA